MKYKLLTIPSNHGKNNIGDYVQALAASQFYPSIDGFVNREAMSDYKGEQCKVIMNGWYMHHPEKWPPSDNITPLFVAFHLNDSVKDKMLSNDGVSYLKKNAPIGCRDYYTKNLLKSYGIDAYFSGCLTLTLGLKYKSEQKSGKVYIVDPMIPDSTSIVDLLKDCWIFIKNPRRIININKKLVPSKGFLRSLVKSSRFYRTYTVWFDSNALENAIYIIQQSSEYTKIESDMERLKVAEGLVRGYAQASFVITSRIHCALPCIGLETPVYFVRKENDAFISTCRFNGLIDLFNVFFCGSKSIRPDFVIKNKIGIHNLIPNKAYPKELIDNLERSCWDFINK